MARFSLDGVLGAFALSKNIIIITIGLAIGAMFVRSLTRYVGGKTHLEQISLFGTRRTLGDWGFGGYNADFKLPRKYLKC